MDQQEHWKRFLMLRARNIPLATPNLLGVGAARSATTSLYHLLSESPDIYMSSVKELAYFSNHFNKWTEREYLLFFHGGESYRYRGEISPHYLHSPDTPQRIKSLNPGTKIIIQLRNPLKRTVSHFRHHYQHHKIADINAYFRKGLDAIRKGVKGVSFSHPVVNLRQSFYFEAVSRYLQIFDRNTLVLFADDFKNDGPGVMAKLSAWLDIELSTNLRRINISQSIDGSGSLHPRLREELVDMFAEDFAKTCAIFGRDVAEFTM